MIPRKRSAFVVVAQHTSVEDLWDVTKTWYFVGSGPTGEELSGSGPESFFHGEETLTLNEGAFNLAVVDGRVDRIADVLQDC